MLGAAQRAAIIDNLLYLRREVEQGFLDVAHWNDHVRKPDEARVDPDPYGDMTRLLAAIDEILEHDPGHGPIAILKWERAH